MTYLNHPGPFPLDRYGTALAEWRAARKVVKSWSDRRGLDQHTPNTDDEMAAYERAHARYRLAGEALRAASPHNQREAV